MALSTVVSLGARDAVYQWILQVLLCVPDGSGGPVTAQYCGWGQSLNPATSVVVPGNQLGLPAGNLGIAVLMTDSPGPAFTVTDTQGNTWTQVSTATAGILTQDVFTCPVAKPLGVADGVTFTAASAPATGIIAAVYGLSGVSYVSAVDNTGNDTTATVTVQSLPAGPYVLVAIPATGTVLDSALTVPAGWTQFGYNSLATWADTLSYLQSG
jgi:hypothetical protein